MRRATIKFGNVLLVAGRELRQIVRARSFWLALLILPIVIAVTIYNRSGREAPIRVALMGAPNLISDARSILTTPPAGVDGDPRAAPRPQIDVVAQLPERADHGDAVAPAPRKIIEERLEHAGTEPLDAIARLTVDSGASPLLEIWTKRGHARDVGARLEKIITERLVPDRSGTRLKDRGRSWTVIVDPAAGKPDGLRPGRSVVPTVVLAYLLLVTLLATGSWMLQGTVEERSNKLLEAILTCVSGTELMLGKLLGGLVAALCVVSAWVAGSALIVIALVQRGLVVAPKAWGTSPIMITPPEGLGTIGGVLALAFFFVAGLAMMLAVFLAIGALSDSVREAQGFLSPVILLIILPLGLLAPALLSGAPSHAADVMTWIPIYTPFLMLARIGTGVGAAEAFMAAGTVIAFVGLEAMLLRRIFAGHLLARHPGPLTALRRVFGRSHVTETTIGPNAGTASGRTA